MKNLALRTAILAAVADNTGSADLERDAQTSDGTVVPKAIKNEALIIIHDAFKAHEQVVAVSKRLLNMAKQCVKSAKKDYNLALAMFKAALADAEMKLKAEATTKAQKEAVEEFLKEGSSWLTYVRNISRGLKAGIDPSSCATESAYRAKVKAAQNAPNNGGGRANETPEQKIEREHRETEKRLDAIATVVAKDDAEIAGKVSLILKAIKTVDMEEGNNREKVLNILNQTLVSLNRMIPVETGAEESHMSKPGRTEQKPRSGAHISSI